MDSIAFAQIKPTLSLFQDDGCNFISALAYSAGGNKFLSGAVDLYIWDTHTGEKLQTIKDVQSDSAALSNDESMVAVGRSHRWIRIWNTKTGELLYTKKEDPKLSPSPISVFTIAFSPKGDRIIFIDQEGILNDWNYKSDMNHSVALQGFGVPWPPNLIQFFEDGERIFYSAYIISLTDKKELYQIGNSQGSTITLQNKIAALHWPDGFTQNYHILALYDSNSYEKIYESPHFVYDVGTSVEISPDGRYVLVRKTAENKEQTRLIDTQTAQVSKIFVNSKGESENIDRILFSPNGKQVALVSGITVNLYDISDLYSSVPGSANLKQ